MKAKLNVDVLKELMRQKGITQSALARRSRVSRATIAKVLARDTPWVRLSTAAKLSEAVGVPQTALDPQAVEAAYLARVAKEHESLDFTGLGLVVTGAPMPMDRGFVQMTLREWPVGGATRPESGPGHRTTPSAKLRPATFSLAAALARSGKLFLLGEPGSGKTTVLRHLARVYARGQQRDSSYPPEVSVPIYVHLAEWAEQLSADPTTSLFAAGLTQLPVPDPAQTLAWLRQQAQAGRALILLDGLDEVADPDSRSRVLDSVRSFLSEHERSRVVITSRVVGFEAPRLAPHFDTLVVEPLGAGTAQRFIEEWCSFRHGHPATQKCPQCKDRVEQLHRAIADDSRIRALAANPLTLTILALLHEAGAALPQGRWELYEKVAEAFLFSWEEKKRQEVRGALDRGLDLESREVVWVLESLALQMQRRDWTLAPRWWLLRHVSDFLRADFSFEPDKAAAQADTLVGSLQKRSSLLVERASERFGFSHLAFQEYFAARAVLSAADPVEALRPHFYHPAWQEVVRLVASQIDRHRAPQLLRAILDDPDPTGRFLHRGPLIVNACLAEGAPLYDRALQDEVSRQLARWRELVAAAEEQGSGEVMPTPYPSSAEHAEEASEVNEGQPPVPGLPTASALTLAHNVLQGTVAWRDAPIEKIEGTLASLTPPSLEALGVLRSLLDERERRGLGIPREARIARALSEFRDRIRAMFVFGSAARNEQGVESDIDLMVIGDVTLRELTPGLKRAEEELGRQVNLVAYSADEWRERCRRKDPFVMNVLNGKIVFVSGDRDELRAMGG